VFIYCYRGKSEIKREEIDAMRRVQITQRPRPPKSPVPLDLRTPSGRPLPF
jgi:hypothetical protein